MDMPTSLAGSYATAHPRPFLAGRPLLRSGALAVLALAVAGGLGWKIFHHSDGAAPAMPTPTLGISTPLAAQVVEWDDYVGRFAPSQSVEVRPRVGGQIIGRHFRDGDIVQKGQLLFTIDARPYRATLAEAQANVASARSALALAKADLARASRLSGDEAVSGGEIDALRAKANSAQAAFAAAQARTTQAGLLVEFTQVRAPIAGRISDRRSDTGNLVSGGDGASATLLTTINALDPIYFTFDSSEALYLKAQRDRAAGRTSTEVEVKLQDEPDYRHKGRLDFTDNGVDSHSGTIRSRAVLSNPGLFLTPGLFGSMRLSHGGMVPALLVPDEAIQSDQARKTVLVVGRDGAVAAKPVVLGPVTRGLRVIRSGLERQDRVVITNLQSAMIGAKVNTRAEKITASTAPAATLSTPAAAQVTLAQ